MQQELNHKKMFFGVGSNTLKMLELRVTIQILNRSNYEMLIGVLTWSNDLYVSLTDHF